MLKSIKTEAEFDDALARIYDLMQIDLIENSPEWIELETLSILVEAYDKEHYPIPPIENNPPI